MVGELKSLMKCTESWAIEKALRKARLEGFVDGKGYQIAFGNMIRYIDLLKDYYNHRDSLELETLKRKLERSNLFLKIFNKIHKETLGKYSAEAIKELCIDYDLITKKTDLITAFRRNYRPLKHYIETKEAEIPA